MDSQKPVSKLAALCLTSVLAGLSLSLSFQTDERAIIEQAASAFQIDGILTEWEAHREFPVQCSPEGVSIQPSSDIEVKTRFTFDASSFYCAVVVKDDFFEFQSRGWRYGDGFYLTFIDPQAGNESDRFSSFGFSLEGQQTIKILVNKDGTYFPSQSTEDILCVIKPDEQKGEMIYELSIPFSVLAPFKPFISKRWAVNLVYVDGDPGERTVLQLFPDRNYDTELVKSRKGQIFEFLSRLPSAPEFQSAVSASHIYQNEEISLKCVINSPSSSTDWTIRSELSSAFENVSSVYDIDLSPGLNTFTFPLEKAGEGTGVYDLSIGVIDAGNSLRFREDHQFFLLQREDLTRWSNDLAEAKTSELHSKSFSFRESLPSLEIRLNWIKAFMEQASPSADVGDLKQWTEELNTLFQQIKMGNPALFPPGQISRLAHRSNIDDTLQPYSLYVPFFDQKIPLPLIVTLHGSGVDERTTIRSVSEQAARRGRFLVLAPQARGLSDWYLGASGEDVLECIAHVQKLYPVDQSNIILDGFSMGGYGAWRLSCLYPQRFRAVIIRSGALTPPAGIDGDYILDLLEKKPRVSYFIVHGGRDSSVVVDHARLAASRLRELGAHFEYVEIKGGAHGDYDRWNDIFEWLRKVLVN